jgi:hypothetical protein
VYVLSRMARLAQANVVPILKTMAYRDRLIPTVAAVLDDQASWTGTGSASRAATSVQRSFGTWPANYGGRMGRSCR